MLKRYPVVEGGEGQREGGEGQRLAIDCERDRSVADQVLDLPAVLSAQPDLDVAVLTRNQEDLLDRGDLAVVGELDAAVVCGGRGREHLDDEPRFSYGPGAALGSRAGHNQISLVPGIGS